MTSAAEKIAAYAARAANKPLSPLQRHLTYRALLDTFAVAIPGQLDPTSRIARDYALENAQPGKATIWATGEPLSPEFAAWVNGIMGHVLDYDDVMTPMRGHVSIALVPALIALAQYTGTDGAGFSAAYVVGFEVLAKISKVMAIPHYAKGWHSTASLGVLGATAACGALLGLNERQIVNALGIATAQAAGNRENFGTSSKSFQAGECAAAAVRSALLARAGFTGGAEALDGKFGYMTLYAQNEDLAGGLEDLGAAPLEIEAIGIDVKKYPCCYATHKSLDAILDLRRDHGLTLEQVQGVSITSSSHGLEALRRTPPKTGLEGKFSMEYVMAAALMDGGIRLATFDDAAVMRPAAQAFFSRVTKQEADGPVLPRWVTVTASLTNGKTVEKRVVVARGDAGDPLSDQDLIEKVEDCFAFARCGWDAKQFAAKVFAMSDAGVDSVIRFPHSASRTAKS